MTEIEKEAESALRAVEPDGTGFAAFMQAIQRVVTEPGNHAEFVAQTAPAFQGRDGARSAFRRWAERIFRSINFGNEDDTIDAVARRSQLEFAYDLYKGTVAEEAFDNERDEEQDDLLAERARDFAIDPPPGIPRSHRWWRWSS
jgi:hypothetical protein